MKKIVKTLLTMLLVTSLLAGCTDGAVTARLAAADSLMADHPDSALALLDRMQAEKIGWAESQRMRHALLTAKAMNKAFVDFTTDSVMREVADYYDSHGTANDRLLAHYLLGCTYRDLGETPRAVDSFMDAIAEADTTAKDCDFYTLSSVYSQMADAFHLQLLLTNEIEARRQASKYAFMANRPYWGIYNQDMAVGAYILLNKLDSAEILQKKVIKLYQNYNYPQAVIRASRALLHLYVESSDRLSEAKPLLDKFESEYGKFDEHHEPPLSERQYFYYKGRYYEHLGLLDSAEYFYRKIYRPSMSYTAKDPMYKGLLSIFWKRHQPDSIAKYAQLYCEANDSSIIRKGQELTAQMAASYKYQHFQKEALDNEAEAYLAKTGMIVLVFILILMACVFLYRRKIHHDKQCKMREEYSSALVSYQDNLRKLQILDNAQKEVIEAIKQELGDAQKTISNINSQYETTRRELMEENEVLRSRICELERQSPVVRQLEHTKAFSETEIIKRIQYLLNHPSVSLSDEELNALAKVTGQYYPPLLYDLNQANAITVLGKRVCMLAILNLRPGDIAHLLNISVQQVSNLRYQLNLSLFGVDSARSLYKNLVSRYGIYAP